MLALLLVAERGADVLPMPSIPPSCPATRIELPRDEGSHPQFRTEWWYLTGWLEDESGEPLGFQLTFFRNRPGVDEDNPSRFVARQVLFAHAAVSDPRRGTLLRGEKSARAGFGLAECGGRFARCEDRRLVAAQGGRAIPRRGCDERVRAASSNASARSRRCCNGKNGFSQKSPQPQFASYYYSLPQLQTSGRIAIGGREHRVRGVAWFDHEWSSGMFDERAHGWDWIGLNLDDGGALMVQRIRDDAGKQHWAAATLRDAGQPRTAPIAPDEIAWSPLRRWRSPRTGVTLSGRMENHASASAR